MTKQRKIVVTAGPDGVEAGQAIVLQPMRGLDFMEMRAACCGAMAWARAFRIKGATVEEAYNACPRPDWLCWLTRRLGVPARFRRKGEAAANQVYRKARQHVGETVDAFYERQDGKAADAYRRALPWSEVALYWPTVAGSPTKA
jgi:hypothetical protein